VAAPCASGVALPIPGFSDGITASGEWLAGLIAAAGGIELVPLAFLVGAKFYNLADLCSAAQPAQPTFNQDDFKALLPDVYPLSTGATAVKVNQLVDRLVWEAACHCQDGTVVPPSVIPPVPGSGVIAQPSAQACHAGGWTGNVPADATTQTFANLVNVTNQVIGSGGAGVVINTGFGNYTMYPPLPGATSVAVTYTTSDTPQCVGTSVSVPMLHYSNTGTAVDGQLLLAGGGNGAFPNWQQTVQIPAGIKYWAFSVGVQGNNCHPNPVPLTVKAQVFCGSAGPGVGSTPCPPDPLTQALLQAILAMVTLIQRQQVPFAYVPGASHLALSGKGEISVQGLWGAKITPSNVPPGTGVDIGDPDTLWLDSWINWGNADGWSAREFLRSAPYISTPNFAGQYTKIGYSLEPQLTVDLVELVREP
jgi:hypothetical protein